MYEVCDYKLGIRQEPLCYLLLRLVVLVNGLPCLGHENMFDVKALYVGKELWKETLPLQSGSRVYKVDILYVLVTVEPEGIVAKPDSEERSFIIYNIVCEEQLMCIPYSSWSVAMLVVLCLVVAFIAPWFLPSSLLIKNQGASSSHRSDGKDTRGSGEISIFTTK